MFYRGPHLPPEERRHPRLPRGGRRGGIEIQRRHLGTLVGYFASEIGPINEIVHIWAFASLDDREARRARLGADPEWQAFLPRIRDLIEVAETKIMKPAAFSPVPTLA